MFGAGINDEREFTASEKEAMGSAIDAGAATNDVAALVNTKIDVTSAPG
jgi:hypothetical protein